MTDPGNPPGQKRACQVFQLPGRPMDRSTAITAVVLAEVVATDDVNPRQRPWLNIEGRSAELDLTVPDALIWISQPLGRGSSEQGAAVLGDPEAADA